MGGVERRQTDHSSRDSSLVSEFDFMEQKELLRDADVAISLSSSQGMSPEGHFPSPEVQEGGILNRSLCVVVVCDIIYTHASSKTCSNCSIIHFRFVLLLTPKNWFWPRSSP